MTKTIRIDVTSLSKMALASSEKETYVQLEKTSAYRIGVGARANSSAQPSFFVEVIINLAKENRQVDLQRLENALPFLKLLKAKGYTLTYEDGICISCETTSPVQDPSKECEAINTLIKEANL